ncbi:MAG: arginyltransferase [Venatoribacter sp.]
MTQKSFILLQPEETHPCSYLKGQQARSVYINPKSELDDLDLTLLSQNGFRRSGKLVYRPNCPSCNACQSVRIPVHKFQPSKSQKRIKKKNKDLTLSVTAPSKRFYPLFEKYIRTKHQSGDMYPANEKQFDDFLCNDFGNTGFLVAQKGQQVLACMVFDLLRDGLSSVYCFYDTDYIERSLGTFMILTLNDLTNSIDLKFNYLGYYIKDSPQMNYKNHFHPIEFFNGQVWQDLTIN